MRKNTEVFFNTSGLFYDYKNVTCKQSLISAVTFFQFIFFFFCFFPHSERDVTVSALDWSSLNSGNEQRIRSKKAVREGFVYGQAQMLLDCNSSGLNSLEEAYSLLSGNTGEATVTTLLFCIDFKLPGRNLSVNNTWHRCNEINSVGTFRAGCIFAYFKVRHLQILLLITHPRQTPNS